MGKPTNQPMACEINYSLKETEKYQEYSDGRLPGIIFLKKPKKNLEESSYLSFKSSKKSDLL